MARANVYDENKVSKKKKGKTFWAIISSCGVVIIAGIVLLILWACGVFSAKEAPTYFEQYDRYKINFSQLTNRLEDSEFVFVMVYDNDTYDTLSDSQKNTVETQVSSLVTSIEDKASYGVSFYMIDTSVNNNSAILENESYGNFSFAPQLLFFYNSTFYVSVADAIDANPNLEGTLSDSDKDTVFSCDSIGTFVTVLRDARELVSRLAN